MMATFTKDFIEINLSTDELMLKELERRDGIYSFIFHELEGPKSETPTISISPEKLIDRTYTEAIERTRNGTTTTITTTDELNDTDSSCGSEDTNNNSLLNKLKIKVENALNQQAHVICHSNNTTTIAAATKTNSITHSPSQRTPTSLIRTLPTDTSNTTAGTTTNATPAIIVPSLFTTATTTTLTDGVVLPPSLPSLSSLNMRNYHEHFKTWHPPPSFVYDNPKLYAYIANCGFRVRLPTPRFSHISAPLVRNRRHALKETPQYKRMCAPPPVADLRTLFPHDPDVHAPFASSTLPRVAVTLTGLSDVTAVTHEGEAEKQVVELVEADDSCCGGMTMVGVVSALK